MATTSIQIPASDNMTKPTIKMAVELLDQVHAALILTKHPELEDITTRLGCLAGDLEDIKINQYEPGEEEHLQKLGYHQ